MSIVNTREGATGNSTATGGRGTGAAIGIKTKRGRREEAMDDIKKKEKGDTDTADKV
jgi:hypothetical protein